MKDIHLSEHRDEIERLLTYVPWLESKCGSNVSREYTSSDLSATVSFPVYDSTLLSFVNEASKMGLMDDNYVYAYSTYGMRTIEDEKEVIENAGVKDGDALCGVLSKYVLGGMIKGSMWTTAVKEGIFLMVLNRMKKLLEIWDAPLA